MMSRPLVLRVEDLGAPEALDLADLSIGDFEVRCTGTLAEAEAFLAHEQVDLVLLDLDLPDSSGLETLRRLRKRAPHTAILAVGDALDRELEDRVCAAGAHTYLVRGNTAPGHLVHALRTALALERVKAALRDITRPTAAARLESFAREVGEIGQTFKHLLGALTTFGGNALAELPPLAAARLEIQEALAVAQSAADLSKRLIELSREAEEEAAEDELDEA